MKCDVIVGSVVNGWRQPILYSFVLDKLPGYKVFCQPETVHYKKINKSVLTTITFYLEDDNNEEVDFNGETLFFTIQTIKIWTNMFTYRFISSKWALKNLKLIVTVLEDDATVLQRKLLVINQLIKKW